MPPKTPAKKKKGEEIHPTPTPKTPSKGAHSYHPPKTPSKAAQHPWVQENIVNRSQFYLEKVGMQRTAFGTKIIPLTPTEILELFDDIPEDVDQPLVRRFLSNFKDRIRHYTDPTTVRAAKTTIRKESKKKAIIMSSAPNPDLQMAVSANMEGMKMNKESAATLSKDAKETHANLSKDAKETQSNIAKHTADANKKGQAMISQNYVASTKAKASTKATLPVPPVLTVSSEETDQTEDETTETTGCKFLSCVMLCVLLCYVIVC